MPSPKESYSTVTMTGSFLQHVWYMFDWSIEAHGRKPGWREGLNAGSEHAPAAYILAAVGMEAFLNEVFLSQQAKVLGSNNSPIWNLGDDEFKKVWDFSVPTKAVMAPFLTFLRSPNKGENWYAELVQLIQLRNALVHYKFTKRGPKAVDYLTDRKIFRQDVPTGSLPWTTRISTTEGIRWAYNTVYTTMQTLIPLIPGTYGQLYKQQYPPEGMMTDEYVKGEYAKVGITQTD